MRRWPLLSVIILLTLGGGLAATTVVPPSFDELVEKADVIFVGEVVERRSYWDNTREERRITTAVTFDVVRLLKGRIGLRTVLFFLGGSVGDVTMDVAGMPAFHVGDRDVLFVSADRSVSPIVGFWHGRFRLADDPSTGETLVRAHDGSPLLLSLDGARAARASAGLAPPLTLRQFQTSIEGRVAASTPRR